jgi:hypothetical protein
LFTAGQSNRWATGSILSNQLLSGGKDCSLAQEPVGGATLIFLWGGFTIGQSAQRAPQEASYFLSLMGFRSGAVPVGIWPNSPPQMRSNPAWGWVPRRRPWLGELEVPDMPEAQLAVDWRNSSFAIFCCLARFFVCSRTAAPPLQVRIWCVVRPESPPCPSCRPTSCPYVNPGALLSHTSSALQLSKSTAVGGSFFFCRPPRFGWPLSLLLSDSGGRRNADGTRKQGKDMLDHFRPSSKLFPSRVQTKISIGTCGILGWIVFLVWCGQKTSSMHVLNFYVGPYMWVNAWLVLYTWLQHTDSTVPHYGEAEWTWMKGALGTIDRPYGIFDFFHHKIGSTHVVHHLFHEIPFYHADEATVHVKAKLGKLYNYDGTFLPIAAYKVAKECHYVGATLASRFFVALPEFSFARGRQHPLSKCGSARPESPPCPSCRPTSCPYVNPGALLSHLQHVPPDPSRPPASSRHSGTSNSLSNSFAHLSLLARS